MPESCKLNRRQEMFAREYLVDYNATQAALRAGYSARTAYSQGQRLLKHVEVRRLLDEADAERRKRLQLSADDVLGELALLGRSDIGQVLDFTGDELRLRPANLIPESARRAISSVKVRRYTEGHGDDARQVEVTEFKLWDKLSALEKVGKHLDLFREKLELLGKDGKELIVKMIGGKASMDDL
jgi:phage terminase small subunit